MYKQSNELANTILNIKTQFITEKKGSKVLTKSMSAAMPSICKSLRKQHIVFRSYINKQIIISFMKD